MCRTCITVTSTDLLPGAAGPCPPGQVPRGLVLPADGHAAGGAARRTSPTRSCCISRRRSRIWSPRSTASSTRSTPGCPSESCPAKFGILLGSLTSGLVGDTRARVGFARLTQEHAPAAVASGVRGDSYLSARAAGPHGGNCAAWRPPVAGARWHAGEEAPALDLEALAKVVGSLGELKGIAMTAGQIMRSVRRPARGPQPATLRRATRGSPGASGTGGTCTALHPACAHKRGPAREMLSAIGLRALDGMSSGGQLRGRL
jgi:hypothetical protein